MLKFLNKLLSGLTPEKKAATPKVAVAHVEVPPVLEVPRIEIPRLDMLQYMWGDGISSPGNLEYLLDLAKPFLLNQDKTALNLTSGFGGYDRAIAERYKTYVHGLERNKELVDLGQKLAKRSKFGSKCTLTHYDPEQFAYEKKADAVICRELFYAVTNKDELLGKLANIVKSRGHVMITDFTCENKEYATSAPISQWTSSEPHKVTLLPVAEMASMLDRHGFDVRITEDMTSQYVREIWLGLAKLTKFLSDKKLTAETRETLKTEVDYWVALTGALGAEVRNTRFYAIKKR